MSTAGAGSSSSSRSPSMPFSPASTSSAPLLSPVAALSSSPGPSTDVHVGGSAQAATHRTAQPSSPLNTSVRFTGLSNVDRSSHDTALSASSSNSEAAASKHIPNNSNSSTNDLREWYRRERANSGSTSSAHLPTPSTPSSSSSTAAALAGVGAAAAAPATGVGMTPPTPSSTSSGLGVSSPFTGKRREKETRAASESKPRRPSSVFDLANNMFDRFKGKMTSTSSSTSGATGPSSTSGHSRNESGSTTASKTGPSTLSISTSDPFAVQEEHSPLGPDSPSAGGSNASHPSAKTDRLTEPEVVEVLHSPTSPRASHAARGFGSTPQATSSSSYQQDGNEHQRGRFVSSSSRDGASSAGRGPIGSRPSSNALDRVYIQVTNDNERFSVVDVSGLSSAQAIKELMYSKLQLFDPNDPTVDRNAFQVFRTEIGVEEGQQATQPYIDDDSLLALCLQFGDDRGSLKFLVKKRRPSGASRPSSGAGESSAIVSSPHQVPQQIWQDRDTRSHGTTGTGGSQPPSHRSNTSSASSSHDTNATGLHRSRAQVKRHGHSASTSTDDSFGLSPTSTPGNSSLPYVHQGHRSSASESSPRNELGPNYHTTTPPPQRGGSDAQHDSTAGGGRMVGHGSAHHQQQNVPVSLFDDGRPPNARSSSFSTQNSTAVQAARDAVLSNAPSRSQSATVATAVGRDSGGNGAQGFAQSGPGHAHQPFPEAGTPSPSHEFSAMMYEQGHSTQSNHPVHGQHHHYPHVGPPPPLNRNTSQPSVSSGYQSWAPSNAMGPHSMSQPGSSVTSPQIGFPPSHPQHLQHQQQHQMSSQGRRPMNGLTIHSTKSMDDIRMRMPPAMPPPGSMPGPPPGSQLGRPPPTQGQYHPNAVPPHGYPVLNVTRSVPSGSIMAPATFDPRLTHSPSPIPSPQMRAWTPQGSGPPPPLPGAVLHQAQHYHPADPRYRSPSVGAAQRVSHYDPRYPPPPPPQGRLSGAMGPPMQHIVPPQRPMSAVPMPPSYATRPPPPPPATTYGVPPRPVTAIGSSGPAQGGLSSLPPQYSSSEFGARGYPPEMRANPGSATTLPSRPHTFHDQPQYSHHHAQPHQPHAPPGYRQGPPPLVIREDPFTSAQFPNSSLRQVTQFQVAPTKLQPGMTVQQSLQARNNPGAQGGPGISPGAGSVSQPPQARAVTPSRAGSGSGSATATGWSSLTDHDDPYHRADAVARLTAEAQQQRLASQQNVQRTNAIAPALRNNSSGSVGSVNNMQITTGVGHPVSPTDTRAPSSPLHSPRSAIGSGPGLLRVSNPSNTTPQSPAIPLPPTPREASSAAFAAERSSGSSFASAVSHASGGDMSSAGTSTTTDSTSSVPSSAASSSHARIAPGGTDRSGPSPMDQEHAHQLTTASGALCPIDKSLSSPSFDHHLGAPRSPRSAVEPLAFGHGRPAVVTPEAGEVSSPRQRFPAETSEVAMEAAAAGEGGATIRPDLLLGTVSILHARSETAGGNANGQEEEDEDTLKAEKWESLRGVLTPSEARAATSREEYFKTGANTTEATRPSSASPLSPEGSGLGLSTGPHSFAIDQDPQRAQSPPPVPQKIRTNMSPSSPELARPRFAEMPREEGTYASFASFDDEDEEVGTWAQPLDPSSTTANAVTPMQTSAAGSTDAQSVTPTSTIKAQGGPIVGFNADSPEATFQALQISKKPPGDGPSSETGTASPRPPKLRIQTVPTVHPITPRLDAEPSLSTSPISDDEDDDEDAPKSSAVSSSLGRSASFAKHGNDWALRPPPEELYDNLDDFFPKHDLDKPVVEATTIPGSPLVDSPRSEGAALDPSGAGGLNVASTSAAASNNSLNQPLSPFPGRTRHKRSIRLAAEDGKKVMERKQARHRVNGAVGGLDAAANKSLARRASTKLWGSKVVEMTPGGQQDPASAVSVMGDSELGEGAGHRPLFRWVKGDLIGKGTYGRVYLALNITTGEMIAVKQVELPRTDTDRESTRQKGVVNALKAEIQTLQYLDHPHIVSYLGFEETSTHLSIFLEYVPGGSVGSCIRKYGKFEEPVVSFFLHQMLEGLAYLHDKGILHRDLKADNILVDWDGICKISDFGTVRKTDDIYNNQEMSLQGSIFWMAPEVINMTADGYSAKVDIWSLGCVVLEMLAGRRPWSEQEAVQAMLRIGSKKQTPPIPNDVHLSVKAQHFLDNTFEIDPTTRPTALKLLTHVFSYVPPEFHFEDSKLHAAMSRARRLA